MVLEETIVNKEFIAEMDSLRQAPSGSELLEACSNSIVLFAEKMLGFRLYAWQVLFLTRIQKAIDGNYWTKEFNAITSRQIGKSLSLAILSIWVCTFNKYPGTAFNNTIVGVASATDLQAKKLLNEVKKIIYQGDIFMKTTYVDADGSPLFPGEKGFFSDLLEEKTGNNSQTITFKAYNESIHGDYILKGSKAGSVIKSYPPTSVVLGETFTIVVIDEAGKSDKISDEFFYEYMYPTGNSTDAIRIYTSTPWVQSGFFFKMVDPLDEFSSHSSDRLLFTINALELENKKQYDVVMKIVNELNEDGKIDEVSRAYYCRFVKGETSFFDPVKARSVFVKDLEKVDAFTKPCDLGVDWGGKTKGTELCITYLNDDNEIIRLWDYSYPHGEDTAIIADIEVLFSKFNIQRIIPDDCPQGEYRIQEMINKGWELTPMSFRSEKVAKYHAFKIMLNKGKVLSYIDKDLMTEMVALEYASNTRQSYIQPAPGYTDDKIDAFLLSSYHFIKLEEEVTIKSYSWKNVRERVRRGRR